MIPSHSAPRMTPNLAWKGRAMQKLAIGGTLLLLSAGFSTASAACRIQGPGISPLQNDKVTYTAIITRAGCRHIHYSYGSLIFQKATVMKDLTNGTLTQVGEFSFFYKPKLGFWGNTLM